MKASRRFASWMLAVVVASLAASAARADRVATPEETRALRAKLASSPPTPADYAAKPYPGATFDPDCSAGHTAPRQPDGAVYCFYTRDPVDTVRAYVKAEGRPHNGVTVTVGEGVVAVDGIVKISGVTMITYWTSRARMAHYESFPASPPPAEELIAPLYPGATYDKECSAAKSLEARGKPKWRPQVWCYVVDQDRASVGKGFDMELISTSRRGVQVELVELSRTPAVTQIVYWLAAAGPQVATPAAPQPSPAPAASTSTPPASAPSPNSAGQALDAANKLRGLFGR